MNKINKAVNLVEIVKLDNGDGYGYGYGDGFGYGGGYGYGYGYGHGLCNGNGSITDKTINIAIWATAGAEVMNEYNASK